MNRTDVSNYSTRRVTAGSRSDAASARKLLRASRPFAVEEPSDVADDGRIIEPGEMRGARQGDQARIRKRPGPLAAGAIWRVHVELAVHHQDRQREGFELRGGEVAFLDVAEMVVEMRLEMLRKRMAAQIPDGEKK